jgi:hypothetical protein
MVSLKIKLIALTLSVLFLFTLKYVIDESTEALPQVLQLTIYASLPIAGGITSLSFCALMRALVDVEKWAASLLSRQFLEKQASCFFIGFVAVAYLSLIRPPLVAYVPSLPYAEWIAVALVVYVMYTVTGQSTKEFYVNYEGPRWATHVQKVRRETGRDLMRITSAMEQFVNHGAREPLLVYLSLHLQRLGENEEGILKILSPLIEYEESTRRHGLLGLGFPWTKRKLAADNKKARENLLNTLLKTIDEL